MIARIWRGVISAEQAEEYFAYSMETGLKYCKDKAFLLELEPKVTHYEYESYQE